MPDVFPRRNLPGDSDVWGRAVEKRTETLETSLEILQQGVQAQNRNTASSLQVLADAIRSIPIAGSMSNWTSGFSVPAQISDLTWTPIARVDITNPAGRNLLNINCIGGLRIYEQIATVSTTTLFSRVRAYRTSDNTSFYEGGDYPGARTQRLADTQFTATAIMATSITSPPEGIYVVLEVATNNPANFTPFAANFGELTVQTSFL